MPHAWHVRVDGMRNGKRVTGAGLLVDPRHVLTCAHVVTGCSGVRVSFVQADRPDLQDLPADLACAGPWRKPGDRGDVAVLTLAAEVAIKPARLSLRVPAWGDFAAHGFPPDAGPFGATMRIRTGSAHGIGEWLHVEGATGHAEMPRAGFSGAGVYNEVTGHVFGIISDASTSPDRRTGRMIPLAWVRRYWEDLDDLLELGWLSRETRRKLRSILRRVGTDADLTELVETEFHPATAPPEFWSVWDAARYVAEELYDDDRLGRFLEALILRASGGPAVTALRVWMDRHLEAPAPHPGVTSVVVRLDTKTKGGYELGFSHFIDGKPYPGGAPATVTRKRFRREVEAALNGLMAKIARAGRDDPMIEFLLPRSLILSEHVDEWYACRERDIPMTAYRVVVRDVVRLGNYDYILRDQWKSRSRRLRDGAKLEKADCSRLDPEEFYRRLLSNREACVVVFSETPGDAVLTKGLDAGVPVMLWPRASCADATPGECPYGSLDTLALLVDTAALDGLPERVRRLRVDPGHARCGPRLTLLWDDPTRIPDPPTFVED
ncbi:trypsin-like peptidase domain-containing protein [Microbispora rosea]|uniref:VMAP-C domain-containing protein n=1 Tax=Microbispora rosea TaxID=58117 RepID=UPI0037B7A7F2